MNKATRIFYINNPAPQFHNFFFPVDADFFDRCDEDCPHMKTDRLMWVTKIYGIVLEKNGYADFLMGTDQLQCRKQIALDIFKKFRGFRLALNPYVETTPPDLKEAFDAYLGLAPEIRIVPTVEWVHSPEISYCPKCGRLDINSLTVTTPYRSIRKGDRWEMGREYVRQPGEGYLIPRSIISNHDSIYIGGRILITERLKNYIEFKQYTNVDMLEYGEIIEDIPYTEPTNDAILAKIWENSS